MNSPSSKSRMKLLWVRENAVPKRFELQRITWWTPLVMRPSRECQIVIQKLIAFNTFVLNFVKEMNQLAAGRYDNHAPAGFPFPSRLGIPP